jgi:uncharacterized membrane protein YgcG
VWNGVLWPAGTLDALSAYNPNVTPLSRRFAALLLVVLALSGVVQAKSFRFQSIEQDVYFRADGTVRVVDVRTYAFSGTYSNAFLNVDPRSNGSVRFEGVEAIDGKAAANPRVEGNTIRWSSPATDETRKFRITYVLSGELEVASDAAQFDRQVLEPVHAPVDRYVVRLHAPAPNPSPYRVFVFTGRSRIGQLNIDTPGGVATVSIAPISQDEPVRTRVLLPASQFTARTIQGNRFSTWIEEVRRETQGFRDASRGALERGGFAPPPPPTPWFYLLLPFVGLAFVSGSVWDAYQKYGREPHTVDVGRYYREPAEDIPPSVVPFVLTQSGGGSLGPAVSATLLDFARKGFVTLQKRHNAGLFGIGASDETDFRLEKEPTGNLTPFEQNLWRVLRSSQGGDGVVTPGELRSSFQNSTSLAPSLTAMPRQWYEVTKGALVDQGAAKFTTPTMIISFIVAVGCVLLGFFALGALGFLAIGIALIVSGVLTLIVAIIGTQILPRWNADKLLNAKRWVAYRNFLSDFSQMETAPAEHYKLWDYHFVYATALGVAQAYLKNLRRIEEAHPGTIYAPVWLGSYSGGSSSGIPTGLDLTSLNSLESIASNLHSLESGLSPKSSGSGGGFGGGSMGGSSGGGGSSGAN